MRTYKITVEETFIATYWVTAHSELHAKSLWENGDIAEWDRHVTEQNDELILIEEYELETTNG